MAESDHTIQAQEIKGAIGQNQGIVTITFHNGDVHKIDVLKLFTPLTNLRREADHWKALHVDFQTISLKLTIIRGLLSRSDIDYALHDLEIHWQQEASEHLRSFVQTERLPDGSAKHEFIRDDCRSRWLDRLQAATEQMDSLVDGCSNPDDFLLRISDVIMILGKLERVAGELMKYLDSRLQRTLRNLSSSIEDAQGAIILPPPSN